MKTLPGFSRRYLTMSSFATRRLPLMSMRMIGWPSAFSASLCGMLMTGPAACVLGRRRGAPAAGVGSVGVGGSRRAGVACGRRRRAASPGGRRGAPARHRGRGARVGRARGRAGVSRPARRATRDAAAIAAKSSAPERDDLDHERERSRERSGSASARKRSIGREAKRGLFSTRLTPRRSTDLALQARKNFVAISTRLRPPWPSEAAARGLLGSARPSRVSCGRPRSRSPREPRKREERRRSASASQRLREGRHGLRRVASTSSRNVTTGIRSACRSQARKIALTKAACAASSPPHAAEVGNARLAEEDRLARRAARRRCRSRSAATSRRRSDVGRGIDGQIA